MIITIATVIIPIILQLLFIFFAGNYVDKVTLGQYVIVNSVVISLSQLCNAMPNQVINKYYNSSRKPIFINEMISNAIILSCIAMFINILYLSTYAKDIITTTSSIYVVIYTFILVNNLTMQQLVLIGLDRKGYFYAKLLDATAKFFFPIVFYYFYRDLSSLIIGSLIGYCLSFTNLLIRIDILKFKFHFNREKVIKYLIFSYPVMFTAVASWIISFSDRFFIDYFVGNEAVGKYSLLVQVANFCQVLGIAFNIYIVPIVMKKSAISFEDGIEFLNKNLKRLMFIILVMTLIFVFIPESLFAIFLGDDFFDAKNIDVAFILIVLSSFLAVYQTALSVYFTIYESLSVYSRYFIICSFVNLGLNFFIIQYGMLAATVSTFVSYLILNIFIGVWITKKRNMN